ncbi:MAG: LysR family transcriptional regulator, partial [Akkermansiaceae bacterium]|nr:LysR family transcriptional regulator [Akkermansiaceae bacterium]
GLACLNEMKDEPAGPLTLTTTTGFGSAWLSSRLHKFHDLHPEIEVTLLLIDNEELDLRQRHADCAIRFQHPEEPRLVRRFIDDFSYHIY